MKIESQHDAKKREKKNFRQKNGEQTQKKHHKTIIHYRMNLKSLLREKKTKKFSMNLQNYKIAQIIILYE